MVKRQVIRKNTHVRVKKSEQYIINLKYLGGEPEPIVDYSSISYAKALNWYNYMCTVDDAREYIKEYLKENNRIAQSKLVSKVTDTRIITTVGWIARLSSRGSVLPQDTYDFFERKLNEMLVHTQKIPEKVEQPTETVSVRDRMRERASEIIGDIECIIDSGENFSAYEWLKKNSIPASYASMIISHYTPWFNELNEAVNNPDAQLKEAYSKFTKAKLKQRWDFINSIITDCAKYSDVSKKIKKVQKPRSVSNEKLLKNLKYQKEDKNYKIASVNPEKIIGARELWTFNTKYKFITIFRAIDRGGFSVKGTTITNFDEKTSICKSTGRKTEELIASLCSSNKTTCEKLVQPLKDAYFSARINENTILLKIA
jgi:hypothetical protein